MAEARGEINMANHQPRVLITGATGFIGCRLAERLSLGGYGSVRVLVHKWSGPGLARLGRLPVEMVEGDVLNMPSLLDAVRGCNVVVHCAFGNMGTPAVSRRVTVEGTDNILRAAVEVGVDKFIYLSTAVVHGRAPKASVVDESATFQSDGDNYSQSKIKAEKRVWEYHQDHGLPIVVFRPFIVYGPYGNWTMRLIREITAGAVLVNGGEGIANIIYIDSLIDAILLAIKEDAAKGQAFIATDDDAISWADLYKALADITANHPPLQAIRLEELRALQRRMQLRRWTKSLFSPLRLSKAIVAHTTKVAIEEIRREKDNIPWARVFIHALPDGVKERIKIWQRSSDQITPATPERIRISSHYSNPLPDENLTKLHTSHARFPNTKMKQVLGWRQRISFEEGIELVREWAKYQRLV